MALTSWLSFCIALTLYWITADPGVSYWDCPEYVTVASLMEVGHPPGNPIWMLLMRVLTIPFPQASHAYVINLASGVFTAFAVFFAARIAFIIYLFIFRSPNIVVAGLTSLGGALCFAFCDSVWFSAVEAEVYALSIFLATLSLWIMCLWWFEPSLSRKKRLLILLAYITGISLGVHQLNLLLIPVFVFIVIYKKTPGKLSPSRIVLWNLVSFSIILLILFVSLRAILWGAEYSELFGVNTLGMPYNSGAIFFTFVLVILIILSIAFSSRWYKKVSILNTALWMAGFLFLGFSSFAMIAVRANSYPVMNEGVPDNIFSLDAYMSRDQYPSPPLLYGATPYSKPMFKEEFKDSIPVYSHYILEKGNPRYQPFMEGAILNHRSGMLTSSDSMANQSIFRKQYGYLLADYSFNQYLTPELDMWFPRITSRNANDILAYEGWAGMNKETMERVPVSETLDTNSNPLPRINTDGERIQAFSYRPTYIQNLRYFISYQFYYMYFRYLLWNFVGRQNDFHSQGEIEHGNFITGIPVVDHLMPGETEMMPKEISLQNKGRNRYFALPFILGIIGMIFLSYKSRISRRVMWLIFLLFIITGLAIVVYLNQLPGEPRERDYTFLASYLAFSLWISVGFAAVSLFFSKIFKLKLTLILTALLSLGVPALMAVENFDDHDRRGRYHTTFYASSLLDFEKPAIIFTHGDNMTFPAWYASEVLKIGEEHNVIDVTYLGLPSYVVNLKRQPYNSLNITGSISALNYGRFLFTKLPQDGSSDPVDLKTALSLLYSSEAPMPEWPASRIIVKRDRENIDTINLYSFTDGSSLLSFRHLILLDLMAGYQENGKILFFPSGIDHKFYKPLDNLLHPALFGKIYAPELNDSMALQLLKTSLDREIRKMKGIKSDVRYADPLIRDKVGRYRGELSLAAAFLLDEGDTVFPVKTADLIAEKLPYSSWLPTDFTISDTTYYEGKKHLELLLRLHEATGEERFLRQACDLDSLLSERHKEWMTYYNSLSPSERRLLSNRSKRLLISR